MEKVFPSFFFAQNWLKFLQPVLEGSGGRMPGSRSARQVSRGESYSTPTQSRERAGQVYANSRRSYCNLILNSSFVAPVCLSSPQIVTL